MDILPAHEILITAGRTLATLTEQRSFDEFADAFREVAAALEILGDRIDHAIDQADQMRDQRLELVAAGTLWHISEQRLWSLDEVHLERRNEIISERESAIRTAKRTLIELSKTISELEASHHD